MGGQAFTHLSTPRMPPPIYFLVLSETQALLKQHYALVASPVPSPAKNSHGDIDIIVSSPLPSSPLSQNLSRSSLALKLAQILGAVHHLISGELHFAIPWPESSPFEDESENQERKFIQIDIKICPDAKTYAWELFHEAHGDLMSIIGSTIRRFGLTVNDTGLYLRIEEIEKCDRKKSLVFLTDQPGRILQFLGLEAGKWESEFGSKEEMFEYAAGCRLFWVGDDEGEGEEGLKKLKHNDRARVSKRPVFREWMEEFLPRCRAQGRFSQGKAISREQVREEAFEEFGVREEFSSRLKAWTLVQHQDDISRSIKDTVPKIEDLQFRAEAIKALKSIVLEGDMFKGKAVLDVAANEEGFWDADKVRIFVEENWKEAGEIGMVRQQENAKAGMKAKAEKKQASKKPRLGGEIT